MDDKTARKITKAQQHAQQALAAATDLPDWLEHTAPSAWDAEVIAAHAAVLEKAGCQLRRLLKDPAVIALID